MSASVRTLVLLAALAALLVSVPQLAVAAGYPAFTALATRMAIYAIFALSLNLILGYGGMISFGHAAYFGIGGYTVAILYAHFSAGQPFLGLVAGTDQLLLTLPAAMLASGFVAAIVGSLALRTSGVQFIIITLAFAQMLYFVFVGLKAYGGDDGITVRRRNALPGIDTREDATYYYIVLVCLALYLLAIWRIVNSRFGQVLAAVRQNERRLAAIGIPSYRYKLAAFVVAGMGAGLSGALMTNYARFASPDMMHWAKSGEGIIMVVLGGIGTLLGPVFGAVLLIGLEDLLSAHTQHWQLFLGVILLAIVLSARGGVSSLGRLLRGRGGHG